MSTLQFSPGEYLAGSTIRNALEAASDELVRRGWPAIVCVSGTRLLSWQESIFRARYVPATQVNGRTVYDFQWWNGVLWARISSAGRVAPPSPTAPHVANIASDLGYPYNVYGPARDALLQVVRDLGLPLSNTGIGFGEVWHWESTRGAGAVTAGGNAESFDPTPILEELMGAPIFVVNVVDVGTASDESGTIWYGRDDGTLEKYEDGLKAAGSKGFAGIRDVISAWFLDGKKIPKVLTQDLPAARHLWARICNVGDAVTAAKVLAQNEKGQFLYWAPDGTITTSPNAKPVYRDVGGLLASTSGVVLGMQAAGGTKR